jgi:threonine dehydrogenase-like Zn-dependent dehydrogenase
MLITGFHRDGGFAERVAVPKSSLISVPESLPGHLACLAEPLACVLNAIEQSQIEAGQHVLIYGAGPVGLLMALAVKHLHAQPYLFDIRRERLGQSEEFRSKLAIEVMEGPARSFFDSAVNAAPSVETLVSGLPTLRSGGCFCIFSGLTGPMPVDAFLLNEIHYRQLRLVGAYGCTRLQMQKALEILSIYKSETALLVEGFIELEQVPRVLPKILAGTAYKYIVRLVD